jgi:hypothetical protein
MVPVPPLPVLASVLPRWVDTPMLKAVLSTMQGPLIQVPWLQVTMVVPMVQAQAAMPPVRVRVLERQLLRLTVQFTQT